MESIHIEKASLSNLVADQLAEYIYNGKWELGQQIPSEAQLTQMFNVSRVSIRSALNVLRERGLIRTIQGKGSFVQSAVNVPHVKFALSERDYLEIIDLRTAIEEYVISRLLENGLDKEDEKAIKEQLDLLIYWSTKPHYDYEQMCQADYKFHLCITRASKNNLFSSIIESSEEQIISFLLASNKIVYGNYVQSHIDLFDALKNSNRNKTEKLTSEFRKSQQMKFKNFKEAEMFLINNVNI